MNDNLRKTIQNFLVDHDNTASNFNLADYMLWLDTAIELLQKCVVDDYKIIPQDGEKKCKMLYAIRSAEVDTLELPEINDKNKSIVKPKKLPKRKK